jgi:hypothetical protein
MAPEAEELGSDIRLLLHGPKNRAYKIYFRTLERGPSGDAVQVFHIRHWARKPIETDELEDLMDETSDSEGESDESS